MEVVAKIANGADISSDADDAARDVTLASKTESADFSFLPKGLKVQCRSPLKRRCRSDLRKSRAPKDAGTHAVAGLVRDISLAPGRQSRPPPAAGSPWVYVGSATQARQNTITFIFLSPMNGIDFLRRFGEC